MIKTLTLKSLIVLLISSSLIVGCGVDDDVALNKCFITNVSFAGADLVTFNYTSDNKLSTEVLTSTDNGVIITETLTMTYDSKGNISKVQDSDGYSTFVYNDNNQITRGDNF